MAKYGNRKVTVNGNTYDSKLEYRRHCELLLLERAGQITSLQRQVPFVLIPTQREPDTIGKRGGIHKGKLLEKECKYIADFVYIKNGETVVEDTKGLKTKDYIIKRKLMLYVHGIRITEISKEGERHGRTKAYNGHCKKHSGTRRARKKQ